CGWRCPTRGRLRRRTRRRSCRCRGRIHRRVRTQRRRRIRSGARRSGCIRSGSCLALLLVVSAGDHAGCAAAVAGGEIAVVVGAELPVADRERARCGGSGERGGRRRWCSGDWRVVALQSGRELARRVETRSVAAVLHAGPFWAALSLSIGGCRREPSDTCTCSPPSLLSPPAAVQVTSSSLSRKISEIGVSQLVSSIGNGLPGSSWLMCSGVSGDKVAPSGTRIDVGHGKP